jgi:FKBP-type peptidyl-prolyl cis-trans isomerase FkpA
MLESMAQTEGARKLPTGVVVHVLEHGPAGPGRGVRPTANSVVEIHYHGTLPDGTIFDTTMAGEPVQLPLAQVIPGWRDGVMEMHEGESMMMGIPPALAYGQNGTPDGSIPGGATLFFKVQLLKVVSGGAGGEPGLLGVDGKPLSRSGGGGGSGLLGANGRPL